VKLEPEERGHKTSLDNKKAFDEAEPRSVSMGAGAASPWVNRNPEGSVGRKTLHKKKKRDKKKGKKKREIKYLSPVIFDA